MRIAFDMSNVIKRGLLVGVDAEFGRKVPDPENPEKMVQVNGWQYGLDNSLSAMIAALNNLGLAPRDVIMVFDGKNSSALRKRKVPPSRIDYKARGKRPDEFYVEYNKALEELRKVWLELGAAACEQPGVEADDVFAFLAENTCEDLFIWSHDGDLCVLQGTNARGAQVHVGNNDQSNVNPFGAFDTKLITVYKALVGDTSDKIPGAFRFGDAAFLQVLGMYGEDGLDDIAQMIERRALEELQENVAECKVLKRVIEDAQNVYDSYTLAKLYPDAVDTLTAPLNWTYGLLREGREGDDTRLRKWYSRKVLVGAHNFKQCVNEARNKRVGVVALDLETSSASESDEWLEARKRKLTNEEEMKDLGVDVFAQYLVSCGITVGDNGQYTYYFTSGHSPADGIQQIPLAQLGRAIKHICDGAIVAVHNANFEIPVLGKHLRAAWAAEGWGEEGYLPNVHCTKILAGYVDENKKSGLKPSSKLYLNYDQETFEETTTITGRVGELPPGGKLRGGYSEPADPSDPDSPRVDYETRQYKMHELTATHVFSYGADDPHVTMALYHHWKFRVQLEGAWGAYCNVEQAAMYPVADSFVRGVPISLEKMRELERDDDAVHEKAWQVLRTFLMAHGWEGTVPPVYTQPELTAAEVKQALSIVHGHELKTQVRKLDKLATLIEAEGFPQFAEMLRQYTPEVFTKYVQAHFKGEPEINFNSPIQMQRLMYEVMNLPVRVANKPTEAARARGEVQGSPKTDELAIQYALRDCAEDQKPVLEAIRAIKMVETRRKMYYRPYANIQHWEDRKVHASINQSATNTRRYTASSPNVTQLPKHPKATGEPARFREVYVPHKPGAVVVSMDFEAQELRMIADYSRDAAMLACFDPENPKDMHALTALGIMRSERLYAEFPYEAFMAALEQSEDPLHGKVKVLRALGKKTNFTTEFGAQAKKLAQTLLISEEEAQKYIDAKLAAFPEVEQWKRRIIEEAQRTGISTTKLGAVRHLREALNSDDRYTRSKADRQAVNFRIQSSSAEMTKRAIGRMWQERLFTKFDAQFYFPVHDETVSSVHLNDLVPFVMAKHACMVQPYADMTVPITSSIGIGWNFGELIEIGNTPTIELLESTKARLLGQLAEAA